MALISSSSDSDDIDMEIPRLKKMYKVRTNFIVGTDFEFKEKYRVSRVTAEALLDRIGQPLEHKTSRSKALTPPQQLLTALHWMGNGGQYHGIADMHGLSKSTVRNCVSRVLPLIKALLMPEEVRWPSQGCLDIPVQFMKYRGFPRVAGCVDGSLIPMDAPNVAEEGFVDRHGDHSLNIMVVCGPNLEFFYANEKWPGSVHDSRVLRNSSLAGQWDLGWRPFPNAILLGDSGYPLKSWLIPPVINSPLDACAKRFLRSHKSTRRVVECALGILKEKFMCLNLLRLQPKAAAELIYTCITIHNMEKRLGSDHYEPFEDADDSYDLDQEYEMDDEDGNAVLTEIISSFA